MQALWAVPPPVADSEHRCMHFFSHDCCATVGTDIVARQSKADAQTSFDIIASLEVAICGPEYRCGSISSNNQNPAGSASRPYAYQRAWRAAHCDHLADYQRKYRARKRA